MTPLDWLVKLMGALDKRAAEVEEYEEWYEGEHPIPSPPPNTPAATDHEAGIAYQAMCRLAITNFLPPIVDLPASKLRIEGYRSSRSNTSTDADLWAIHRRNHLVTDSVLAIREAIKVGQTAAIVWPGPDGAAEISLEDPEHVIICYEVGSRRRRASALKRWKGDDGKLYATVYLPDGIYKYVSKATAENLRHRQGYKPEDWEPREVTGETWPVPNPWGVVPVVEIRVNAGLKASRFGGGCSQFEGQLVTQQRINHTVFGRLITEEYQSYRQRWVTGWDPPVDEDGKPDKQAVIKAGAARFQVFNNDDETTAQIRVGEFAQADFQPFLKAVQEDVKHLATTSGTPPYAFLLGDMVNVAADALARIEGTHLATVRSLADEIDESFVEIMRLALLIEGDERAKDPALSVIWGEFEQRTASEQILLAQGAKALGAPDDVVFAMLPGVDQAEAARWVRQMKANALVTAAQAAVPPPA